MAKRRRPTPPHPTAEVRAIELVDAVHTWAASNPISGYNYQALRYLGVTASPESNKGYLTNMDPPSTHYVGDYFLQEVVTVSRKPRGAAIYTSALVVIVGPTEFRISDSEWVTRSEVSSVDEVLAYLILQEKLRHGHNE